MINGQDIQSVVEMLAQHGQSPIDPTEEQLRGLLSGSLEGPFHFVNLLKFRTQADYPEDHELAGKGLSGAEAYDQYGAVALAQVTKRGGRLITLNEVERTVIGGGTGWERIATMEYPSINAFIEMLLDAEYQASLVHRNAGLEATEVYASRPLIAEPLG